MKSIIIGTTSTCCSSLEDPYSDDTVTPYYPYFFLILPSGIQVIEIAVHVNFLIRRRGITERVTSNNNKNLSLNG